MGNKKDWEDIALTARQIDELLSVRVSETHYSNHNDASRHLIAIGFIQRISGTDIWEVTEKGEAFMQYCGLKHAIHYSLNMKPHFTLSDSEYKVYVASGAKQITFYTGGGIGIKKVVTNEAGGVQDITDYSNW